jgi:hypothetical protein
MPVHELCLLSGLRPGGGPPYLLTSSDEIDLVVEEMADEIKAILETTPPDLLSIIRESLALAFFDDFIDHTWNHKKPSGLAEWSYFDVAIAIGYFDEASDGNCGAYYHNFQTGATRAPNGRNVELRRVYSDAESAYFNYVVTEAAEYQMFSDCRAWGGNPNFFVLEGCYKYLEAWLCWDSLPPRGLAFPADAAPMSIPSEFYEIVNSQKQPRRECQHAPPMYN